MMRLLCRVLGHQWRADERGAPVIPVFAVCGRCRAWTRVLRGA